MEHNLLKSFGACYDTIGVGLMETIMFFTALVGYMLFTGSQGFFRKPKRSLKKKTRRDSRQEISNEESVAQQIQIAVARSDHAVVLEHWKIMKGSSAAAANNFASVVESMKALGKDNAAIVDELRSSSVRDIQTINDALERLAKLPDAELVRSIVQELTELGVAPDQRSFDALLNALFAEQKFAEIVAVVSQMEQHDVALTSRSRLTLMKTAISRGDLMDGLIQLRQLKASPSGLVVVPSQILVQLVSLASRESRVGELVVELSGTRLLNELVQALTATSRAEDCQLAHTVQEMIADLEARN